MIFLFHLEILCTSLFKLNPTIWSVYKYHVEGFDLFFLGLYCLTFVLSLAVWLFANESLRKRVLHASMLFPVYLLISLVAEIIVSRVYGSAVF